MFAAINITIRLLTNIVFPFPGGPNNKRPLAGALNPVNNCKIRKLSKYKLVLQFRDIEQKFRIINRKVFKYY